MKNHLRIPEKYSKRNEKASLWTRVGKQAAAVALAFSAQYGALLQAPADAAAATRGTRVEQAHGVAETSELAIFDQDALIADGARTLQEGLVMIEGTPAVVFPVQDAATGKRYLMVHPNINTPGLGTKGYEVHLAKAMGCEDCELTYPDTQDFMAFTQEQLDGVPLTQAEKQRIYFSRAFQAMTMTFWQTVGNSRKSLGVDPSEYDRRFQAAADAFHALDDGTPAFQERLQDLGLFQAIQVSFALWGYIKDPKAYSRDIDRYSTDVHYVATLQRAAELMQARTAAFQAGEKPLSEFMMDRALFGYMTDFQLEYIQGLAQRGIWADQRFKDSKAVLAALLPALQEAFAATANVPLTLAQTREQIVQARQLLGLETLVATRAYQDPGFSPSDMNTWAQNAYQTAQGLLATHSADTLSLPSDIQQQLDTAQMAYANVAPDYARLAAAGGTAQKLRALLARTQGVWTPEDEAALKEIYQTALASSSTEAQEQFLAVLREGLHVSKPDIKITPYEQTGLTVNHTLRAHNVEEQGEIHRTSVYKLDTVEATFSIENTLPIPLRVTFVVELPGADNARDVREVYLEANKIADVHYTGHVEIQRSRSGEDTTPKADLQLAMRGLQEAATRTPGELQIARAE